MVITYLFSRSSLAITLFVTLCFPFPVTPETFFVRSPFAQKMRENVGVDFFFKFCLFVSKVCFCFLSHNLRFRYTKNILCTFTNCSKNFVKMLGLIFFFKSLVVSKVCFLSQTLPLSVSVTPKTFFVCSPIAHKIQCAHYAVFRFRYTNNILYKFFSVKRQYDN